MRNSYSFCFRDKIPTFTEKYQSEDLMEGHHCKQSSPLVHELIFGGPNGSVEFDICQSHEREIHSRNATLCSCCNAVSNCGLLDHADCSSISSMSGYESSIEGDNFPIEEFESQSRENKPASFTLQQSWNPHYSSATVVSRDLGDESDFFENSDDDCTIMRSCSSCTLRDLDMAHPLPCFERFSNNAISSEQCFAALPDELTCNIASYLDISSLRSFGIVSTTFRELSTRNNAGWEGHCSTLWSTKAYVPNWARAMVSEQGAIHAYNLSMQDSILRQEIEEHELCFDPKTGTGFVWDFRFKENAGPQWTQFDPWFAGGRARRMVFLRNGNVQQLEKSEQEGMFTLIPPFSTVFESDGQEAPASLDFKWRFIQHPMDLPMRKIGAYIRLTVDGREVPTYVVHRSRTGDWGFVIESCWGVYSSTSLPPKQSCARIAVNPHCRAPIRLRRNHERGNLVDIDSSESESTSPLLNPMERFGADDASFYVSTRRQWREALLYNSGCSRLPEGEGASAEFDRVWEQSIGSTRQRMM